MEKLLIRLTVILASVYIVITYGIAIFVDVNLWRQWYIVFFELCVCACMTAKWRYHCEYLRWTMYGITLAEIMININNTFGIYGDYEYYALGGVPAFCIGMGVLLSIVFATVDYLKNRRQKREHGPAGVNGESFSAGNGLDDK